jgi:alpha-glucosidase (family GH31 glycosyl hydrolase)
MMHRRVAMILSGLLVVTAFCSAQTAAERPFPRPGPPPLVVAGKKVEITILPVSARTVRISVLPLDLSAVAQPAPNDPAIVPRVWSGPLAKIRSIVPPMSVKAGSLTVETQTDPDVQFRIMEGTRTVQRIVVSAKSGTVTFALGNQPLFGLGQGGIQYDRRGNKHLTTPGSVNLALNGMRVPVPWLISPEGWAIFANRPKGEFDLTGKEGVYSAIENESSAPIDLFVSVAPEPAVLMKEYADLTGFSTLPPLWTLGYQQSHRTILSREHVFEIANNLRSHKLPTDALIYLGTGWCPSGWNEWHGSFDFKKDVFPTPDKDIKELKDMNFKVVLHVVGNPERLYGSVKDAVVPLGDLNHVTEYWKTHQVLSRLNIDGWWPDASERPEDAARMARIQMYWEAPQIDKPNVRPYALHRTGYAGMQRYGGWLWSGDVNSTWATLAKHVPMGINTSLSGIPLWGFDIGGFYSTPEWTGELFVRWFQLGAFTPLFRSHGRPSQTHFPWGWNTGDYGTPEQEGAERDPARGLAPVSELRNPLVEPIIRKYLELRYRMLPYTYSITNETHETGLPMIRALWLHYANDPQSIARGDEYLWGRDILVAPVTEKAATSRKLYLPPGAWYDFWTAEKTDGGREVTRKVDLETMPLYVRAGAIVPFGPVKQYTAEKVDAPLEIVVYPGANGQFLIYEDDGVSFNYEKGVYSKIRCVWNDAARELSLELEKGSRLIDGSKKIEVRLATSQQKRALTFDGKPVRIKL